MNRHITGHLLPEIFCVALLAAFGCQRRPPAPEAVPPPAGLAHLLEDQELQRLGGKIFFDTTLSTPPGQSCAACHAPDVGWTGPDEALNKRGSV